MVDSGVVVIDKPRGMTSHDVVAKARRALGTREIGHAGTLDPMATGVLVLAVGEATKLVPYLSASDKEYEGTVTLGVATDTLDADGRETSRADVPESWRDALEGALDEERKRTMQLPPVYSAIHAKGARAHELARRGEEVELAERPVRVIDLHATAIAERTVDLRLVVSKGYYVRALARDLAVRLGTVGHLSALRRVRAGAFALAEAVPLAELSKTTPLIPLTAAAARALPTTKLTTAGVGHARAGRKVPLEDFVAERRSLRDGELEGRSPSNEKDFEIAGEGEHAWLAPDDTLVAIGRIEEGAGRVTRGFTPPKQ